MTIRKTVTLIEEINSEYGAPASPPLRRVATAEARIADAKDRLLAHATTTCLVFEFPKGSAT